MTDSLFCQIGPNGYIDWQVEYIVDFCFEIDLSEIKKFVPARLIPLEVRPGIGIFSLSIFKFPKGNLGCLPNFYELAVNLYVVQDLRKTSPDGVKRVPFFNSSYVLSVAANSEGFLKHTYLVDKMPIYICQNLVVEEVGKTENYNFRVYDDQGKIADLKWTYPNFSHEKFEDKDAFMQLYLGYGGNLYSESLIASVDSFFMHQKQGNAGQLCPHPVFRGLDLSKVSSYCHFQVVVRNVKQYRFYNPELLSPLKPKDFDPTKDDELNIKTFFNAVGQLS